MNVTIRVLFCTALIAGVGGPVAWADCGACDDNGCKADYDHCNYVPTEFADPEIVHWVHRGVSFGNYLKLAKAEFPEPVVPRAPEFESIYFDLDKSILKPAAIETANKVAAYLKEHPGDKVRIEGNCCDLASNEYNMKLGERRANAVKQHLVKQGIEPGRITTISYGEERIKWSPQQRELDRRADVIIWFVDAAQ